MHSAALSRNQILAPEEPNVYSTAVNRTARAPAERNVSDDCANRASFAPLERRELFWRSAFYKHFVPTGRGKCLENLAKKTRSWTFVPQTTEIPGMIEPLNNIGDLLVMSKTKRNGPLNHTNEHENLLVILRVTNVQNFVFLR